MHKLLAVMNARWVRRLSKLGGVAATALSIIGLVMIPTASAASLSMWPTFECHRYSNGTASITVDELQTNDDGYTTVWQPKLQRYTGTVWTNYWTGALEQFEDSAWGRLVVDYSQSVMVAPNSYYREYLAIGSTDGRGAAIYYAQPIAGRYTDRICHT
jgi:hypothetical protein